MIKHLGFVFIMSKLNFTSQDLCKFMRERRLREFRRAQSNLEDCALSFSDEGLLETAFNTMKQVIKDYLRSSKIDSLTQEQYILSNEIAKELATTWVKQVKDKHNVRNNFNS